MNNLKKIILVGIISLSIIFTPISFILLNYEDNSGKIAKTDEEDEEGEEDIREYNAKGIRLNFIRNFNDSIVISWFTETIAPEPEIIYSINSDLSMAIETEANEIKIFSFYIYTAELVNLLPNITYYYQVRLDKYNKREIMNFTTLVNNPKHIRFLVYGDSRTQREERKVLSQKIMDYFRDNFYFTIHSGDIVDHGRYQSEWNLYFEDTEELNAYKQGIYLEGNHEDGLDTLMYDNLLMMSSEDNRYFSFSYGGLGFIILNSNDYTIGDDVQTNWLNQTLIQLSQENSFIFAYMHHPLLHNRSYSYHREKWRPLFEKYNVSIIFAGHNHHYERSYPIVNPTTLEYNNSELYNYEDLDHPIYIVSGGAGAPLYSLYNNDFIAKNTKAYHFLLIDVNKEITKTFVSLEVWVMPNDFSELYLFDNITITKWN